MDLKNKCVIVTGASKGIGLATCHALLNKGAFVIGWSRTRPEIKNSMFSYYACDVSDFKSVNEAFEGSVQEMDQQINAIINNAGVGYYNPIEETTWEEWSTMFRTNVDSVYFTSKLVVPQMKAMGGGHIINIASIAGNNGISGMSAYCGTKHAVVGISHSLYKELREFGIKVTCIFPGSVKTNFFDHMDPGLLTPNMMQPEDIASTIIHCLESSENYHHVDIEVRPLKPKG